MTAFELITIAGGGLVVLAIGATAWKLVAASLSLATPSKADDGPEVLRVVNQLTALLTAHDKMAESRVIASVQVIRECAAEIAMPLDADKEAQS